MSQVPTQQVTVRMTGGPQGASIVGPPGAAGGAFAPVAAATDKNVALTGIQSIDGVAGVVNQRVFLGGQINGAENGIWLQQTGAWTRPTDFPSGSSPSGTTVYVLKGGAVFGRSIWTLETTGVVIDTTVQAWTLNTLPSVHFEAHQVAQTFVSRATATTFPFDTVDHDTVGGWDAATHKFTCPSSGYYHVCTQVRWAADIGGLTSIGINKNSYAALLLGADSPGMGNKIARTLFASAGDTLATYMYQAAVGNAGNDTAYPYATFLTIDLIRRDP